MNDVELKIFSFTVFQVVKDLAGFRDIMCT